MRLMQSENLWAPWRGIYLRELSRKAAEAGWSPAPADNFFLDYWQHPERDEINHVVHRDDAGIVLLNRYPYANGHLLAALGEPSPTLLGYDAPKRAALWRLVERAAALMQQALRPQGINIGINEGQAAGAGVPEHLHAHIVPRWAGDTNFITVVGNIRVVPDALEAMAARYRACATQDGGTA